jgi:hypothetical protein
MLSNGTCHSRLDRESSPTPPPHYRRQVLQVRLASGFPRSGLLKKPQMSVAQGLVPVLLRTANPNSGAHKGLGYTSSTSAFAGMTTARPALATMIVSHTPRMRTPPALFALTPAAEFVYP